MKAQELEQIIQDGEGYTVEFKESVNSDLPKEMVAFANSSGGRIFIGIRDDNTIKGVKIDNVLLSRVQDMASSCDPPVCVACSRCEGVLVVGVKEGLNKPYRCNKGFFIRVGANSQKMSTQEITAFIHSEGKVFFDEIVRDDIDPNKAVDPELVDAFLKRCRIERILDDFAILHNLSVLSYKEGMPYLNNAGVLFFTKKPVHHLYQSVVSCVLFKGTDRLTILDKKDFDADIISNIDNVILFLQQHLNLRYEITSLQRQEILEIPEVALRELVINAVCHRDYFDKRANVVIAIFDDRVEISNPGGLPKGLLPKDFGSKSVTRNPLIASLLLRLGYVEKMGTGIFRVKRALVDAGVTGVHFDFDNFFTVTIPRPGAAPQSVVSGKTPVETPVKTPVKTPDLILYHIARNAGVTLAEIAASSDKSLSAVERAAKRLTKEGKIRHHGPKKGGHWEIITKE